MVKQINRDKVKIKHLIHVKGENYPTEKDFLYEVVSELQDLDMLNGEFLAKHLWGVLKCRITDSGSMVDSLNKLTELNYLSVKTHINPRKNRYSLISHPWE